MIGAWISRLALGNPFVVVWLGVAIALAAASGAWTVQGYRLDAIKSEYRSFTIGVEAQGKVALAAKKAREALDKSNKELADADHKRAVAGLDSQLAVLRSERARDGGLSRAAAPAPGADRTCFDPAGLADALQRLDQGSIGLVAEGAKAVISLNAAKQWAQRSKE